MIFFSCHKVNTLFVKARVGNTKFASTTLQTDHLVLASHIGVFSLQFKLSFCIAGGNFLPVAANLLIAVYTIKQDGYHPEYCHKAQSDRKI